MTTDRDFDRLARAWLETGPDEAPDRVIAAVLQAAETTPQVRRGLRRPFRRSVTMTRLSMTTPPNNGSRIAGMCDYSVR